MKIIKRRTLLSVIALSIFGISTYQTKHTAAEDVILVQGEKEKHHGKDYLNINRLLEYTSGEADVDGKSANVVIEDYNFIFTNRHPLAKVNGDYVSAATGSVGTGETLPIWSNDTIIDESRILVTDDFLSRYLKFKFVNEEEYLAINEQEAEHEVESNQVDLSNGVNDRSESNDANSTNLQKDSELENESAVSNTNNTAPAKSETPSTGVTSPTNNADNTSSSSSQQAEQERLEEERKRKEAEAEAEAEAQAKLEEEARKAAEKEAAEEAARKAEEEAAKQQALAAKKAKAKELANQALADIPVSVSEKVIITGPDYYAVEVVIDSNVSVLPNSDQSWAMEDWLTEWGNKARAAGLDSERANSGNNYFTYGVLY